MSINFAATKKVYDIMIDNFKKTLSQEVVTQDEDNVSGSEELSWASAISITGAFFRRGDAWTFAKEGFFENADAVLMVKIGVSIKKNDKITHDSQTYIVDHVITRSFDGTPVYQAIELFQFEA